jgi:CheY-specific phosphatase CheX
VNERALAAALQASVTDVLEKMFFVRSFGEAEDDAAEPHLVAQMSFEGDPPGSLELRVTAPAARSIAADFLGADESELRDGEVGEVICELANMICGSVLSRVESNTTFRLETPRIVTAGDTPPGRMPAESRHIASHQAEISRGHLMVWIETGVRACQTAEKYAC